MSFLRFGAATVDTKNQLSNLIQLLKKVVHRLEEEEDVTWKDFFSVWVPRKGSRGVELEPSTFAGFFFGLVHREIKKGKSNQPITKRIKWFGWSDLD